VGRIVSLLLLTLCFASTGAATRFPAASCQASPTQDLLPDVIAPMTGASPVWLVDGGDGDGDRFGWVRDQARKTLWVLLRTSAEMRISGRRLDAPGVLKFDGVGDPPTEELVIADPSRRSVRPTGAPPEIMRAYAFIPSLVFYPSPGCWEFTIRIGDAEHRIVRDLKPRT
jgi:hypothetical protein